MLHPVFFKIMGTQGQIEGKERKISRKKQTSWAVLPLRLKTVRICDILRKEKILEEKR